MNSAQRLLSFPGTAHIPACRVRFDSPHFGKFRKLARRLCDRIPDIESGRLRAYEEERRIWLPKRTGLMFNVSYTSSILRSIISSMDGGGRPAFQNRVFGRGKSELPATFMLPSFWDMVMLMREDSSSQGLTDMMDLEEKGVLVRSRKVPIAIRASPGGLYAKDEIEVYTLVGKPVPMNYVVMLSASGADGLVREIIKLEAQYEASRKGGRFFGQPVAKIRRAISAKFRYEVDMSLEDVEEPMDVLGDVEKPEGKPVPQS